MNEDKQFRDRVATITRAELKQFLGTPEGKQIIRSIIGPAETATKKPAAETAVKAPLTRVKTPKKEIKK